VYVLFWSYDGLVPSNFLKSSYTFFVDCPKKSIFDGAQKMGEKRQFQGKIYGNHLKYRL